ncbi:hypothetical protein JRO89_XS08G0009600 [Xanthoceras sorbifolium]|uniref:Uncharacterized protein n=1 Tax=Xanthoceras sorbifolium TaxID=99658 RepID=A0ABQ8HN94_9ROSI|nr:hypothetical protein JRO89_XS08G0009600 [Xanthoceras sorbifolium]
MYDGGYKEEDKVHLYQGLELLPDELKYLHWHRYPLQSLPSEFNPQHLIELEMHHSNIEHLWKDNASTRGDDYGDHVAERVDQSEIEEISNEEEEEQLKEIEEVNGRHCNCSFMSNNCFSFLFHVSCPLFSVLITITHL